MASVVDDPGGRRRILFVAPDGSRKTIRLGKVDRKTAESVNRHVEALLSAKISGQPTPRDTAAWLTTIAPKLRDRLAAAGLVESACNATLADLVDAILSRSDLKQSTKTARRCWAGELLELLGTKPLQAVTIADAEQVRDVMATRHAPTTVGRRLRFARQVFTLAVRRGLLARNPFDYIKHNFKEGALPEREYASVSDVEQLIGVCPPSWRTMIALARFAALRCPSEALLLRWADVDLVARRMRVSSPKTEHVGKPWRSVPITPLLYPYLAEAWELARDGAEYVVDLPQYRDKSGNWIDCNLRTQLGRLMRRAGVFWKRPFRVLRSSCVSDWAQAHPVHAVAAWSGHTVAVAGRHYLTVTNADFERATGGVESGAKSGALEAQKAAQQRNAARGGESQELPEALEICDSVQSCSRRNFLLHKDLATLTGFEPVLQP